jgi:hypothetical protein
VSVAKGMCNFTTDHFLICYVKHEPNTSSFYIHTKTGRLRVHVQFIKMYYLLKNSSSTFHQKDIDNTFCVQSMLNQFYKNHIQMNLRNFMYRQKVKVPKTINTEIKYT